MASLGVTIELLSRDPTTITYRVTVAKAPRHLPALGLKEFAQGAQPDGSDNFTYNAGLPLYKQGDTVDTVAPAPDNGQPGQAFIWAWPDSVKPVSNVLAI